MNSSAAQRGMRTFALVATGQIVSFTGSGLTNFALGLWIYERTQNTTLYALILLFTTLPSFVIAPVMGALVDRWDRRWVIILADLGGGLCTLALALLYLAGGQDIWPIYVALGLSSIFHGFRSPAYLASVSLLVPQEHLGRANGVFLLGETSRYLLAPALAGLLKGSIGVPGVMLIDFATFLFAVATCLWVRFPKPPTTATGQAARGSLLREAAFGWRYISARPGLLGLLIMFALANYGTLLVDTVLVPMLRTLFSAYMTNDALIDKMVGNVMSVGGAGMLVGTIAMIAWGGPKRRMHGVLGLLIVIGLFIVLVGGLQPVPLIAMAVFFYFLPFPLMNSCDQAIWQSKVPPDVQGRVFSVRRMMAWSVTPLAYITAGPLADQVFNPLMASNGPLAPSLGPIIGAGPGRGIGLLISLMGLLVILLTLVTALNPRVRNVEDELPNVLPDQVYEDETVMRQVPEAGASP